MEPRKSIKELFNCHYIGSGPKLYPLERWYNELLDKTISEIDILDVTRMLRQKIFMDLAIPTAVKLLKTDIFAGALYEGELLEELSKTDRDHLAGYVDRLDSIMDYGVEKIEKHEWLCEEDKNDFNQVLKDFRLKIEQEPLG